VKSILLGRGTKGCIAPEIREKRRFAFRGFLRRELDKEALETEIQGVGIDLVEFLLGETTIQGFYLLRGDREVLGHETQRKLGSEFHKKCGQSIDRVFDVPRKEEVANQDSFCCQGVACVKAVQKSLLREHLGEGGKGYLGIILASRQPFCQIPVRIFEVRKIDVYGPFCSLEEIHGLIPGEIEDRGKIIPFAPQEKDELKYIREEMIRSHKINVVNVLL